jgi:lycopene beta-cyclase
VEAQATRRTARPSDAGSQSREDIVIVGTGVSAMLLARSLIQRGCFRALRLIGRPQRLRAHRFSYWSDAEPAPFAGYADASWSNLRVFGSDGAEIPVPLSRFVYRTFPTEAWFADLTRKVLAAPGVELVELRARSITISPDRAVVRTGGSHFEAAWVFSSARPIGITPTLWQRFEGWDVSLEDRTVDERSATFLDFRTPAEGDFRFLYARPLGARRVFVEHVCYQPVRHRVHLESYLDREFGEGRWQVTDREQGATPLYLDAPRSHGRAIPIGVGGGLAKVSTGYALMRIWRDAESIAEGLSTRGHPGLRTGPGGIYRLADRFFVDLLRRAPEQLPVLLQQLFQRASGDAVLAFLDDQATRCERLEVARAMPGWMRWWMGRKSA